MNAAEPILEVYNNQEAVDIPAESIEKWQTCGQRALRMVLEHPVHGGGVLAGLDVVEVSIVDDATIAQVHVDFMGISGATDVITFGYDGVGELVISVETAELYGAEHGNSRDRELMLYIIHGLLHLCGHEDADPVERANMEVIQFAILNSVWQPE